MTRKTTVYARNAARHQADPAATARVLSKLQPFTPSELVTLQTPVRIAFECLRSGSGTEEDFHTIAAAVNIALIRSESIDPLCEQTCKLAQEGLMRMLARFASVKRWGLDGLALQDVPAALDLYEQLLANSTPKQMEDAMRTVVQRMNAGQVHTLAEVAA